MTALLSSLRMTAAWRGLHPTHPRTEMQSCIRGSDGPSLKARGSGGFPVNARWAFFLKAALLGALIVGTAAEAQSGTAPQEQQQPGPSRPPQWGTPPASKPKFEFSATDRKHLRSYYGTRLRTIRRSGRPSLGPGTYFPAELIPSIQPVSQEAWGSLPPIPPGFQAGFYRGFVMVYDPVTYWIAGVTDLL